MEPVVALKQQIALLVRADRVWVLLVVGTRVCEVLMVRLILVDVIQIVWKVPGSMMMCRR